MWHLNFALKAKGHQMHEVVPEETESVACGTGTVARRQSWAANESCLGSLSESPQIWLLSGSECDPAIATRQTPHPVHICTS